MQNSHKGFHAERVLCGEALDDKSGAFDFSPSSYHQGVYNSIQLSVSESTLSKYV